MRVASMLEAWWRSLERLTGGSVCDVMDADLARIEAARCFRGGRMNHVADDSYFTGRSSRA